MRRSLVASALAAMLASCGGGGGGDSSPPAQATPLAITSANYQRVAQESVSSGAYLVDTYQLITGAQVAGERVLLDFARLQALRMQARFRAAAPVAAGADIVESDTCSGGGQISATLRDNNGNRQADAGESMSLVATSCVELGATINGGMDLSLKSISGDPFAGTVYSLSVAITLNSLSATTAAGSAGGSGNLNLDIAMTGPNAGSITLSGSSLSMSGSYGGSSYTRTLQGYSLSATRSPTVTSHADAVTMSGTIVASALEGKSITLATPAPLVQFGTEHYPHTGQVTATGASGSKSRLTVQSNTTVLLELDADGNGSWEISATKAWSELL